MALKKSAAPYQNGGRWSLFLNDSLGFVCNRVEGFASREDMPQHLLFLETVVVSASHLHTCFCKKTTSWRSLLRLLHSPSQSYLKVENFNRDKHAKSKDKLRVVGCGTVLICFPKDIKHLT